MSFASSLISRSIGIVSHCFIAQPGPQSRRDMDYIKDGVREAIQSTHNAIIYHGLMYGPGRGSVIIQYNPYSSLPAHVRSTFPTSVSILRHIVATVETAIGLTALIRGTDELVVIWNGDRSVMALATLPTELASSAHKQFRVFTHNIEGRTLNFLDNKTPHIPVGGAMVPLYTSYIINHMFQNIYINTSNKYSNAPDAFEKGFTANALDEICDRVQDNLDNTGQLVQANHTTYYPRADQCKWSSAISNTNPRAPVLRGNHSRRVGFRSADMGDIVFYETT